MGSWSLKRSGLVGPEFEWTQKLVARLLTLLILSSNSSSRIHVYITSICDLRHFVLTYLPHWMLVCFSMVMKFRH